MRDVREELFLKADSFQAGLLNGVCNPSLFGAVVDEDSESVHLSGIVVESALADGGPEAAAICADSPTFVISLSVACGFRELPLREAARKIFRSEETGEATAEDVFLSVAEQSLGPAIP